MADMKNQLMSVGGGTLNVSGDGTLVWSGTLALSANAEGGLNEKPLSVNIGTAKTVLSLADVRVTLDESAGRLELPEGESAIEVLNVTGTGTLTGTVIADTGSSRWRLVKSGSRLLLKKRAGLFIVVQ